MCGIAGILNLSLKMRAGDLERYALELANCMSYRGPDDYGVWVDSGSYCALSQRRLSIIDTSSAGHQPMLSHDERFVITFNGELYNYLEVREDLEKLGSRFKTRTDTEVVIEAVRAYGTEVFNKLDGMFAFVLFDQEKQETWLARDPFGEKPLYYTRQRGYFAFASELYPLASMPNFDTTLDEESIAQYFALQYIHAPRTIYRSARKLLPGHFLIIDKNGNERHHRHFSFEPSAEPTPYANRSLDDLADELEEILTRSIRRRLLSDVALGAFLSGGVDSSVTVALASKVLTSKIKTFSIGFEGAEDSEHVYAREMAQHLGVDHHEKMLSPNVLQLAETIGKVLDEPNGDSSCLPTYLLSKFAREHVTVALSGDGGDEMFGGYGRYFATIDEEAGLKSGNPNIHPSWTPGGVYFGGRILVFPEDHLGALLGRVPPETAELIGGFKNYLNDDNLPLISRMRAIDVKSYLPGAVLAKVDRMAMQHSLEVRTPFLSREVAAFAEKLSPAHCYSEGQGKLVLKQLGSRYIPMTSLTRKKMGFGLPTTIWGEKELLDTVKKICLSRNAVSPDWIGGDNLKAFIERQSKPGGFSTYQVWSLLIFEIWLRNHAVKGHRSLDDSPLRLAFRRGSGYVQNFLGLRT